MTPSIGRARQSIREASYAYPQSVMDALADAEQFRTYMRGTGGTIAELAMHPIFAATAAGYRVRRLIARRWAHKAYEAAKKGAHAAFAAVPGLRDEEES